VIDSWFYTLEEEVLDASEIGEDDTEGLAAAVDTLVEQRLAGRGPHDAGLRRRSARIPACPAGW